MRIGSSCRLQADHHGLHPSRRLAVRESRDLALLALQHSLEIEDGPGKLGTALICLLEVCQVEEPATV